MPLLPPTPPVPFGVKRPRKPPNPLKLLLESYQFGCTISGMVFLSLGIGTAVPAALLQGRLPPRQVVDAYALISTLYLVGFVFMVTGLPLLAAGAVLGFLAKRCDS